MPKVLSIEEFEEQASTRTNKSLINSYAADLLKKFVAAGDEAWEILDSDINRNKGWIAKEYYQTGKKGVKYANASWLKKIFDNQIKAHKLEDMVVVSSSKGKLLLGRKELL